MVLDRSKKSDLTLRSAEIAPRSPFWRYFHDKLHWPAIFRPGPVSALVRGLALYMDDAREDILWLRRQWLPATADDAMIAAYGASRGIPRQSFDTDESYRRRVINAFAWHKLGGKVRGLERIFAENHLAATILPASNPDWWAHFRVRLDVTDTVFDLDAAALVFWLANEYKPARSRLEYLETRSTQTLTHRAGLALRGFTTSRSRLWFPVPAMPELPIARAAGSRAVTSTRLGIHFPTPSVPKTGSKKAVGTASLTSTRLAFRPAA